LFLRQGVRGTSMEAIARETGIAKATLYGQFPDKTAIFEALIDLLIAEKRAVVDAALAGAGSGVMRAANALSAKHKLLARLLESSPHADELEAEGQTHGRGQSDPFDDWLLSRVAEALAGDGVDNPQQSARLLIACADGIANHVTQSGEIGPAIRLVAERLFGKR
jgi:AcrR family transcriptional regulator